MNKENKSYFNKLKERLENTDWEQLAKDRYQEEINNPNNYSFWYPKVKDCGIKMVNSRIYKFSYEAWNKFREIDGNKQAWIDYVNYIQSLIEKDKTLEHKKIYNIKNGCFSNKFNAVDCNVKYKDIAKKFVDIQYTSYLYGAGGTTELIIRDYIDYDYTKTPTIYNGLPLRTEFRVFVDFDSEKVLYIVNYWDYNYCYPSIYNATDKIVFKHMRNKIQKDYEKYKDYVVNQVKEKLLNYNKSNNNGLTGKWSIDIMKEKNDFYLIDMAIAYQSAYWDSSKIKK